LRARRAKGRSADFDTLGGGRRRYATAANTAETGKAQSTESGIWRVDHAQPASAHLCRDSAQYFLGLSKMSIRSRGHVGGRDPAVNSPAQPLTSVSNRTLIVVNNCVTETNTECTRLCERELVMPKVFWYVVAEANWRAGDYPR
jgi:hypothetical protein